MRRERFWYVATPYSKYPGGQEAALRMACKVAARLLRSGLIVYSPIAATHAIAIAGSIDLLDHGFWLPVDQPFMDAAAGLIVVRAPTWEESYGVNIEIDEFLAAGKPVLYHDPHPEDLL